MSIEQLVMTAAAVILGNAASFAFFFAAMQCIRLQRNGAKDDELPAWVYAGLIVAPVILAVGASLTT